ncbi:MAG: LUD domain-containing protein [Phycisphaeraceae bacterium]
MATTREQFVKRIRGALGRGANAEAPTPPAVEDALIRLTWAEEDLPGLFAERAEAVGVSVRRCKAADLAGTLGELLDEHEVKTLTLAEEQIAGGAALAAGLDERGYELRAWQDDRSMTGHYDVDAGVSGCGAVLAETGTIIYRSGEGGGRGHMLVPPIHVVVVRRSQVLADMVDYMGQQAGLRPEQLPSSQSMITGPSKTADIEGVLITGVHGPGKVAVIVLEDA